MKMVTALLLATLSISCNSSNNESEQKIQELENQVQELKDQQTAEAEKEAAKQAAVAAKAEQDKKDLIISQIREGKGLLVKDKIKWNIGGFTDGSITLENALSGIVFQLVTIETTVTNNVNEIFHVESHDFTNLKPGEKRERTLDPITRGQKLLKRVTHIQSTWLTNGRVITI